MPGENKKRCSFYYTFFYLNAKEGISMSVQKSNDPINIKVFQEKHLEKASKTRLTACLVPVG
jgi:hypothetical protein